MTTRPYVVADLFCGAGGTSKGAAKAIASIGGRMNLVAVNHWPVAVETHQLNHPTARHYIQDLERADPETIVPEGYLDILLASPECRFYSRARGGRPTHDQGRMNPWIVHRWLTSLNVRCLLVENVPEFTDWGPLNEDGQPNRNKKGLYFEEWIKSLWGLGYDAQWKMLNAADFGDATTRVRFFLMARNDGLPLRWPEATHSKHSHITLTGQLPKWRGAREIIDWSNQGRSLLDDPKYRKKPLSIKTRHRIAKGLQRFGGPLAHLYIRLLDLPDNQPPEETPGPAGQTEIPFVLNRHGDNGSDRVHHVDEPIPTATTRGAGYLVNPVAAPTDEAELAAGPAHQAFIQANRNNNAPKSTGEPIPPVTTAYGGGTFLVEPKITPFMLGQQSGGTPRGTQEPVPTVTADGAISLIQPSIIQYFGQSHAQKISEPLSTILSNRKHALVKPTLIQYFGQSHSADVDNPVPTLTTKARYAIANPTLIEVNHGRDPDIPKSDGLRAKPVDSPLGTITTKRNTALAQPILIQTGQTGGNGAYVRDTESPLPTITTKNDINLAQPAMSPLDGPEEDDQALNPYIIPNFGERAEQQPRSHDIDEPLPAVTSRGAGNLVTPVLDSNIAQELHNSNIDPGRLVLIDGQPWVLDIRFRMLQNDELARAMGFEDDETKYEFTGTVTQVTKQIGNAVPVNLAAALVKSVLQ